MIQSNFDNDHLDHQAALDYCAAFLLGIFSKQIRITDSLYTRIKVQLQ